VHLVLAPLQPVEEAAQTAEAALGHPVVDQSQVGFAQLLERHVYRQPVVVGQGQQLLQFVGVSGGVPRRDGAVADRLGRIGDDQIHVDIDDVPESFTLRTCAPRTVVVEQPRLGFQVVASTCLAAQSAAEPPAIPRPAVHRHRRLVLGHGRQQHPARALPLGKSDLQRVSQTIRCDAARGQPVGNHQQLVVRFPAISIVAEDLVGQGPRLALMDDADESILAQFGCRGLDGLVARQAAGKRHLETRPVRQLAQTFGCRLRGIFADRLTAAQAENLADPGVQQTQVIGRFGCRSDGRPIGARGAAASHRDGGWDAVDSLGVRLLQTVQELSRVGRKTLDVAALALGIQRVQRQTGLAAAADAAEHDQSAVRHVQIDRFQVVYADAAQLDGSGRQSPVASLNRLLNRNEFRILADITIRGQSRFQVRAEPAALQRLWQPLQCVRCARGRESFSGKGLPCGSSSPENDSRPLFPYLANPAATAIMRSVCKRI
jgi:hypothetical protein